MRNRPFGRFAAHPSKQDGGINCYGTLIRPRRQPVLRARRPQAYTAAASSLPAPRNRRPLPIKVIIAGYGYISADYCNVALCAIGGHSRR